MFSRAFVKTLVEQHIAKLYLHVIGEYNRQEAGVSVIKPQNMLHAV